MSHDQTYTQHPHMDPNQAYAVPDPLPEDAVCGCLRRADGSLGLPVDCPNCACSYTSRIYCRICNGAGMISIDCPHTAAPGLAVPRTSRNPSSQGGSSSRGSGSGHGDRRATGGGGGSGSVGRQSNLQGGNHSPVRSSRSA